MNLDTQKFGVNSDKNLNTYYSVYHNCVDFLKSRGFGDENKFEKFKNVLYKNRVGRFFNTEYSNFYDNMQAFLNRKNLTNMGSIIILYLHENFLGENLF